MSFIRKFYLSDTHFGHANILAMQPRDFASIEEHGEHLVRCWNTVVGIDDIVDHFGDFAMGLHERAGYIRYIFSRLHGRDGLSRDIGVDLPDVSYTPRTFLELTKSMTLNERDHA